MIGRDLLAVYGRADLIITAVVLVAGIVATHRAARLAASTSVKAMVLGYLTRLG